MKRFGPYRLDEVLGRGGMGIIYRAVHLDTEQVVALKTIRVPQAPMVQAIRREIRALEALDHPGIVKIVDSGLHRGVPWYAMALVDGVSLRTWVTETEILPPSDTEAPPSIQATDEEDTVQLGARNPARKPTHEEVGHSASRLRIPAAQGKLQEVLDLVRAICEPLAYMHGKGLVHRDLKADNILVTPNGQPILVDFGVATRGAQGREVLEMGTLLVGSAAIMAPEQITGGRVDARADLYALGCLLYHLVVGQRPFLGNRHALLKMHLSTMPVLPGACVELPSSLEALILTLLAKNPADRIGHVQDVVAVLDALGAQPPVLPEAPAPPRIPVYRPRFVGRDEALEGLSTLIAEGPGGLATVGGERGSGKTRLLMEATTLGLQHEVSVLLGECHLAGALLGGLRRPLETLTDLCRERGPVYTEQIFGERGPVLAAYQPVISSLPGQEGREPPEELPPAAAQERLLRCVVQTFEALGGRTLLVIDDLHLADALTLEVLKGLLETRQGPPIAVVATVDLDAMGPMATALVESSYRVALSPLSRTEVIGMAGSMLAMPEPPEALTQALYERSAGNPLCVAELVRAAVARGVLSREIGGSWTLTEGVDALPDSLDALIAERMSGLSERATTVMEAAAVFRRGVAVELLAAVLGVSVEAMVDPVSELIGVGILVEDAQRLTFAHQTMLDIASERMDDSTRRGLHGSVAAVLESHEPDAPAQIAHHWSASGDRARAREAYLTAARQAMGTDAYTDAESLYQKTLAHTDVPDRTSIRARTELANGVLEAVGRVEEAMVEQQRAIDEARSLGDPGALAGALVALGRIHHIHARIGQAVALYEEGLELAREAEDLLTAGKVLNNLALIAQDRGEHARARALFEQDLAIVRQLGDTAGECITLSNLGLLSMDDGDLDTAAALQEQAIALARVAESRWDEAVFECHLAEIHVRRGRLDDARLHAEHALATQREIGDRAGQRKSLLVLASLARRSGDLDAAGDRLDEAQAISIPGDRPALVADAICEEGYLALARGKAPNRVLERFDEVLSNIPSDSRGELPERRRQLAAAIEAWHAKDARLVAGERLDLCEPMLADAIRACWGDVDF